MKTLFCSVLTVVTLMLVVCEARANVGLVAAPQRHQECPLEAPVVQPLEDGREVVGLGDVPGLDVTGRPRRVESEFVVRPDLRLKVVAHAQEVVERPRARRARSRPDEDSASGRGDLVGQVEAELVEVQQQRRARRARARPRSTP